jgi:hypothetical protein
MRSSRCLLSLFLLQCLLCMTDAWVPEAVRTGLVSIAFVATSLSPAPIGACNGWYCVG